MSAPTHRVRAVWGRLLDAAYPACMRGVRRRAVAVLPVVRVGPVSDRSAVVRSVRRSVAAAGAHVRAVPARVRDDLASRVRLRGRREAGRAPPQVRPVARRSRCPRGGRRDAPESAGRRRHVGAARPWPKGRARVRSGACAGRGARPPGRRARDATAAAAGRDAAPGDAGPAPSGAPRCRARSSGSDAPGACPPGRRRADHRRDRGRSRRRAVPGRCVGGARSGRARSVPRAIAPAGAVCLSSGGLTSGSVVARGRSPVVDASRGRNDPRKATVGG